ncbi:hypothetical protein BGX33_011745 [Mortierella sp. NVP41]|nr:hypothetical protein BGX33_011745 [Mortierella sp. NVP41]
MGPEATAIRQEMEAIQTRMSTFEERIPRLASMIASSRETICNLAHVQHLQNETATATTDATAITLSSFLNPDQESPNTVLVEREQLRQRRVEYTTELVDQIKRALDEDRIRYETLQAKLNLL